VCSGSCLEVRVHAQLHGCLRLLDGLPVGERVVVGVVLEVVLPRSEGRLVVLHPEPLMSDGDWRGHSKLPECAIRWPVAAAAGVIPPIGIHHRTAGGGRARGGADGGVALLETREGARRGVPAHRTTDGAGAPRGAGKGAARALPLLFLSGRDPEGAVGVRVGFLGTVDVAGQGISQGDVGAAAI